MNTVNQREILEYESNMYYFALQLKSLQFNSDDCVLTQNEGWLSQTPTSYQVCAHGPSGAHENQGGLLLLGFNFSGGV